MRPTPSWLITDEVDYAEVELGNLKSGKEAEVFVVEAQDPEAGPIARVQMPMRLRCAVHGTWVPANTPTR